MLNMVAQLSGIRSLKRFQLNVRPDAEVADQEKRGNIVPIRGGILLR